MALRTRGRLLVVVATGVGIAGAAPIATADNARLNSSVVANVYTVRFKAGCADPDIKISPALQLAAQRYADDLADNPGLSDGLGSDGSTPQSRSTAVGFTGTVVETVAINPAMAINNLDVITQWYQDLAAFAIMADCGNTVMGVGSANRLDRSVVVAVYGKPAHERSS